MYKKLLWITAVAFSLVLSQATFAHDWGCGKSMEKMVESLNLDDAQKAKIKPVLEQLKSTIQSNASQFSSIETQINQQVNSATMDQGTVDGLVDQKTKLIGNMMKAKLAAKNQIIAILTPEQKTKIQDMMKKAEEKMAEKFKDCQDND